MTSASSSQLVSGLQRVCLWDGVLIVVVGAIRNELGYRTQQREVVVQLVDAHVMNALVFNH